ncbi:tRNA (N6-isopentenyl adenosine(37)-C2)-methylthiotransferase MiaB [Geomonas subterranea]|uniref:tRNA-2-methylthio-N(6)-dimethylallyladenosine synthase n=1 Tax=Geomonas subterranea TaxID=2847989 RepID=A0ABX8LB68_9BACT|nr:MULTISPECIES: tRNA (N6-isopentenyl adenosine(37)-C2)-methylthiotransferase MiaB [Geomonas]QXE89253.1 tRNA (N6-isopentenyl adenosine(37)-C2)-methylthiotransferase MiaB [Geomonas subterranea]QXM08634.1 tRNA (N6-isopentenyl adenosine(37)-C2)-methylthiotransferase MiaB [Geomonas subterranea]
MIKAKKLYLETFGCQMNVSDSEKIVTLMKGIGYQQTADPVEADLVLLNTCSIRATAEQRVYGHLGKFKFMKKKKPGLIIGVGGCVAQQEGERLLQKAPFVNLVFGTHNLHLLQKMVSGAEQGKQSVATDFLDDEKRFDLFPHAESEGGVSRFVTVMQGCDNFCAYCIVPHVRGREISRSAEKVVEEVAALAATGVTEVTLLGQNVNSYGFKEAGAPGFAALLRMVAQVEGIERLRFTTSHPKDISPGLIACFADIPKLAPHIHLPAQSGSDAVLKKMNRGYTRAAYLGKVRALRDACPEIQFTGDMIVGFPGEDEAAFEQTMELVEEVQYADLFSFIYSARPGTSAAEFPDEVKRAEKQARLERLQGAQKKITLARNESFVGGVQRVLVEGLSTSGDSLFGRTGGNRGTVMAGDPALAGRLVDVRITEGLQTLLKGEILHV